MSQSSIFCLILFNLHQINFPRFYYYNFIAMPKHQKPKDKNANLATFWLRVDKDYFQPIPYNFRLSQLKVYQEQ